MHLYILDLGFGVFKIFVKLLGWELIIWCYMIMHGIPLAL